MLIVVRKIWREANEEVFAQNAGYFFGVISFQMEENINGIAIGVQHTETTRYQAKPSYFLAKLS